MKINTPQISWHAKEAIYSVDIQPKQDNQPHRLATAGIDANVRIWELKPDCNTGVAFLSNLTRHERAVNIVRFSKCGDTLASGGDDGTVVLWKLNDRNDVPNIFDDESDIGRNVESWNAVKVLRGHLEDVNDLCWSEDGNYIISGSIDHTAIIWDTSKAAKLSILSEAKHFIHGVAYDPMGEFVATLGGDRSLRIYSLKSKRVLHNTSKMLYPQVVEDGKTQTEEDVTKSQRMFHDESVVRRRLSFTVDASLLVVPAGCLNKKKGDQVEQINTAYVFSRTCFSKPAAVLPGFKQAVTVVRSCPVKFNLRKNSDGVANSVVDLPYRLVFAVASSDTVLLYDSQTLEPFSLLSNIHYAAITDITWSRDALRLVISSRDGFCTIIQFDENELGEIYSETTSVPNLNGVCTKSDSKDGQVPSNDDKQIKRDIQHEISTESRENEVDMTDISSKTEIDDRKTSTQDAESRQERHRTDSPSESMETNRTDKEQNSPSVSSSQDKKPRRVQLTTITHSPAGNKPRRVQLNMISSVTPGEKRQEDDSACQKTPSFEEKNSATPKSVVKDDPTPKKKVTRRIQLTTLNN